MQEDKIKKELPFKYEILLIILGIILLVALMSNNNYNPNSLIERLFKPVTFYGGLLHYANAIPLIGIYYLIKRIYVLTHHNWFRTRFMRIVVTLFTVYLLMPISEDLLNTYRSWLIGIEAITLEHKHMDLYMEIEERGMTSVKVSGNMTLENHGDEEAKFQIKVRLPKAMQEIIGEEYLEIEEVYKIKPKKKEVIHFYEEVMREINEVEGIDEDFGELSMNYNEYEFMLYDEQKQVEFEASYSDRYFYLDKPYF